MLVTISLVELVGQVGPDRTLVDDLPQSIHRIWGNKADDKITLHVKIILKSCLPYYFLMRPECLI